MGPDFGVTQKLVLIQLSHILSRWHAAIHLLRLAFCAGNNTYFTDLVLKSEFLKMFYSLESCLEAQSMIVFIPSTWVDFCCRKYSCHTHTHLKYVNSTIHTQQEGENLSQQLYPQVFSVDMCLRMSVRVKV